MSWPDVRCRRRAGARSKCCDLRRPLRATPSQPAGRCALTRDARLLVAAQAARAFAYGLGAVLLGATLDERGFSSLEVGLILGSVLVGTVIATVVIGRYGDTLGRRHCYRTLYVLLALTGVVFGYGSAAWLLVGVALLGALSTAVIESGPFPSLEQAMLAGQFEHRRLARGFSVYNAVAAAFGSLGALAAAAIGLLQGAWPDSPDAQRFFVLLVPAALIGLFLARRLSDTVERDGSFTPTAEARILGESRLVVFRLAALFSLDSFAGGFAVQAFIAYWLAKRFDASVEVIGVTFFAFGVLQTASFLSSGWLAQWFGMLPTMVFTHLPSNLVLIAVAFAPTLPVAIALLAVRVLLSQMDVAPRQAYVMALVAPSERTAAASVTNSARYLTRPAGPVLAGAAASVALGFPFVIAGTLKSVYDLMLWRWLRDVRLPDHQEVSV
ncbi:MAG: MFS transporter [Actinomycetota bacterium]